MTTFKTSRKPEKGFSIKMILPDDQLRWQFLHYLLVGGAAALTDWGFYWLFINLFGFHYLFANLFSFVIATLLNYYLCVNFVFMQRRESKKQEAALIFLVSAIGLVINKLLLLFFIEQLLIHYMLAKIIATGLVFLWNFLARRYYVFVK